MANILEGKKHHFLYRTTNLINGRYYIGMHSTNLLEDNYVGSGRRLWHEIRKYGRQNFRFEILEFFNSREELALKEKEVVSLQEIAKEKCMNLKVGGLGGFPPNAKDAFREKLKDPEYRKEFLRKTGSSETLKKLHREGKVKYDTFTGKKHKPESIQKMKDTKKGQGKGEANSQFGTFWITDGKTNKKTNFEIPEGWYKGRVLKNNIAR
jgi:group I intron endonuclease